MASAFVDHCLDLMAGDSSARARRMFGGHGLYLDDLFVAIVVSDRLYLKVDASTRARFEVAGSEPFVYDGAGRRVTMSYWSAPPEAMESPALMAPWARLAVDAAIRARCAPSAVRPRSRARRPGARASR